jgi:hypothetical protein
MAVGWLQMIPVQSAPAPRHETTTYPADKAYASVLLSQPSNSPVPEIAPEQFQPLRDGLIEVAIAWEIMDKREAAYNFRHHGWGMDLDAMRHRYEEVKNAPRIADAHRFPDRAHIVKLIGLNRTIRRVIEERKELEIDRQHWFDLALRDLDICYRVYTSVSELTCEFYYVYTRRQAMLHLISLIGREAYDNMDLGPPVPDWILYDLYH